MLFVDFWCRTGTLGLLMSLTLNELERIAQLARLQLDPAHAQHTLDQINGFLIWWNK